MTAEKRFTQTLTWKLIRTVLWGGLMVVGLLGLTGIGLHFAMPMNRTNSHPPLPWLGPCVALGTAAACLFAWRYWETLIKRVKFSPEQEAVWLQATHRNRILGMVLGYCVVVLVLQLLR